MEEKINMQQEIESILLSKYPKNNQEVINFAKYIYKSLNEKKDNKIVNWWLQGKDAKVFCDLFDQVANEGLWLDGVHITIQSTGLSYDYIAYKNKMLIAYPESIIDIQLVYEGDDVEFDKVNGKIEYKHKLKNPFSKKDDDIIGGYCIIKNKRGEFLVTQTSEDFKIAKGVSKGDFIWKKYYSAMCMKTMMKRGCKMHFADMYKGMEKEDNKQNDLGNIEKEYLKENQKKIDDNYSEITNKYKDL